MAFLALDFVLLSQVKVAFVGSSVDYIIMRSLACETREQSKQNTFFECQPADKGLLCRRIMELLAIVAEELKRCISATKY